jgi:ribosomal protein S18 acetylase RimI-like enzyme
LSIEILDFSDELAAHFDRINREWIEAMYVLEPHDIEVIENPRRHIIDPGGAILFAQAPALGIVGTVALKPSLTEGAFELTKMGVMAAARGQKIGELLLIAAMARARQMPIQTLYLLTNTKSQAAIHLYQKLGWQHDPEIVASFGSTYGRANVAMRFPL